MEIPAATISQINRLRDGRMVAVDDDVCGVVTQLQEIDPHLRVRWSAATELFVLYYDKDGEEQLVCTTPELDGRLVRRVKEISSGDYGYADELDKLDAAAEKRRQDEFNDRMGDAHERLSHAIRTDLRKAQPARPGHGIYIPPDAYGA